MIVRLNEIERKARNLLKDALRIRASDIHFIPGDTDVLIQYRLANELMDMGVISRVLYTKILSHFKFLAGMDIGEKRKPQNGSLTLKLQNISLDLRLSTLPALYQESLVLRLLPQESTQSLSLSPLFLRSLCVIHAFMKQPSGLIVFTGPTGSGKTTSLYSLLTQTLSENNSKIITLEDPIEKQLNRIIQIQINEKAGLTYASGLKAALRHDPDIIMVGEIRDYETAKVAVRAAYTGHLVLTTMHTSNSKNVVYRLKEMNIPIHDISQTLLGVVAQRLVKLNCIYCGKKCSKYCKGVGRKASIYEVLHGSNLKEVFKEMNGQKAVYNYKTLRDEIIRGIALGFLSDHHLDQMGDDIES